MSANPVPADDVRALAVAFLIETGRVVRMLRRSSFEGLSAAQLSVLTSLVERGPLRLGVLAAVEAVAPPTLTRTVQYLERHGLVTKRVDQNDRRSYQIDVTERGRGALESSRDRRVMLLAQQFANLTPSQRAHLREAVSALAVVARNDR
ncbi:MAG TPA: MarR family transcriptional regulator [Ilumatobacter sp.]|nr:MarR family transcriptional regulator [Ilumatobacter sp.]